MNQMFFFSQVRVVVLLSLDGIMDPGHNSSTEELDSFSLFLPLLYRVAVILVAGKIPSDSE
jgi:hypothetical protein